MKKTLNLGYEFGFTTLHFTGFGLEILEIWTGNLLKNLDSEL